MISAAREARQDRRPETISKPILLFFCSRTSGHGRRVEGFLAPVLQRGRSQATFTIHRIDYELRPDLFLNFGVNQPPALIVLDGKRTRARLEKPRGCVEIQTALAQRLKSA